MRNQNFGIKMNRHLLSSSALHDFSDNTFVRRASAGGINLVHGKKRPKIDIHLEDQPPGFHVPSYTTLDRIHGSATITAAADTPFDDIHISFQGTSRTWVEKIATAAPTNPRTRAFHTFLRLMQPIEEEDVPEQHIIKAGRSYRIPFEFVVPQRLLPQSCSHVRQNTQVEEEHLKLPPSLGDVMVSGDGKCLHCDFAPEMTTISYAIRVVITRRPKEGQMRPNIIGDSQLKLRIVPEADEAPPLEISNEPGEDYILEKTKSTKKGLLMGKTTTGTLHVSAAQPPPLRLPNVRHASRDTPASVMTMVTLRLRFDPVKGSVRPPKLQMLWSRLKIATFFSTVPQASLPNKSAAFSMDNNKGLMVDTLALSSRNLGGQSWTKHISERRDSAVAFPLTDPPSSPEDELSEPPCFESVPCSQSPTPAATPTFEDGPGDVFYTADVLVPIELPYQRLAFVPTFHSCLISRVYALDMNLGVTSGPGNSLNIHLKVPVQITAEGSDKPVSTEGMRPEGGYFSARSQRHNMSPPTTNAANSLTGTASELARHSGANTHHNPTDDSGRLGSLRHRASSETESDCEHGLRRPAWNDLDRVQFRGHADLATAPEHGQSEDRSLVSDADRSGAVSPTSGRVMARSPSPRSALNRLTNDEILNPENYESQEGPEDQFGSFRWDPMDFIRPGEGANRGHGEQRRASEGLPPGYASVAAGTMLIGSGGMIRALS